MLLEADGLLARAGRALRVVHPLPCVINALLVVALAAVAGASPAEAAVLGSAMFTFQVAIGATNDISDAPRDRISKPWKPIPAGHISATTAAAIATAAGATALALSAAFGGLVLLLGAAGLGCGLAYDLGLRQRGLGWLCYALAFPALLAWTWLAAAGTLPPGWPLLLPLAALAGPLIHLANSLVDVEADARAGTVTLATTLGLRRARLALTVLSTLVWLLAWVLLLSVPGGGTALSLLAAITATAMAAMGVLGSWHEASAREWGWLLQALALCVLAVAWVAAAA